MRGLNLVQRAAARAMYPAKTIRELASGAGVSVGYMHGVLRGLTKRRSYMTEGDVMEMRSAYPDLTMAQIAKRWGFGGTQTHKAITGRSFRHLPGAHSSSNNRGWTKRTW